MNTRIYTNEISGVASNVIVRKGKVKDEWVIGTTSGHRYIGEPDVIVNWERGMMESGVVLEEGGREIRPWKIQQKSE